MLNKLKQFKDLREQGKKMQNLLADESVTVRAAGDKVVLTMNGNLELAAVVIDDEMLSPDKKEKLQSAIKEAHADALKKMQRTIATKMQQSGDFKIPGLN
jgi:DNA-binding YbaB/EbfC family protein